MAKRKSKNVSGTDLFNIVHKIFGDSELEFNIELYDALLFHICRMNAGDAVEVSYVSDDGSYQELTITKTGEL